MKKMILALLLAGVCGSFGEQPKVMTKVCVVNDSPLQEGETAEGSRPDTTIYKAGDVLGRVDTGRAEDGTPLSVTIYNDGDLWSYSPASMKGVYGRDSEETRSFHAVIFPMPAMKSLEFGREAAFISKQKVTEGQETVDGVPCAYRAAQVGDLTVKFYSRTSDKQPAYVELSSDGRVAMRFKYKSYSVNMPFDEKLFSKPEGVTILNDDVMMTAPEGFLTAEGKRWTLACGALLNEMNGHRHDILGGVVKSDAVAKSNVASLEKWWNVSSRESLLEKLDWLLNGGHREDYIELGMQLSLVSESDWAKLKQQAAANPKFLRKVTIVKDNFDKTGKNTLRAWDYSRFVNVCGWGYEAGYITEDEAWALMTPVAFRIQQSFSSWKEFGENFVLGREFWSGEKEKAEEMLKIHNALLKNPKSPWNQLKWDVTLIEKKTGQEGK